MDEAEADIRFRRLLAAVESTRRMLTAAGEDHWAGWMDGAHRDLEAHDANGLRRLLDAYGGMGSFSDLVIHATNGDADSASVRHINEELDRLRTSIYSDAAALLRDFERPA